MNLNSSSFITMSSSSQLILNIAGYSTCGFFKRAVQVLSSLPILFPAQIKIIEHSFPGRDEYRSWLLGPNEATNSGFRSNIVDARAHKHVTSPFVWISDGVYESPLSSPSDDTAKIQIKQFIGGHDDTLEWCRNYFARSVPGKMQDFTSERAIMVHDGYTPNHPYDYDLVVIGGGSGGMAASKEATRLGVAKVAVLDFVKPSTQGTTWGLGGTCVNVGCIPKKLMHQAALIHQTLTTDTAAFGIGAQPSSSSDITMTDDNDGKNNILTSLQHNWQVMRDHVQNYIHSLNFKYRVALREKNVTYLNQLGTFRDAHTLDVIDKKGKTGTITAARFLIAVGGRPSPLDCEGGEMAISSDDIFSLETSPGKTLCVGASYISLECAGFLAGLGYDVTVAVRSILLRGFDRECADLIGSYMEDHGVKFRREVIPKKLERVMDDTNRIKVTFSDDSVDVFDTVLVAIGRSADTIKLGLDKVGIQTNPRNGKIPTKYEQTVVPNIYAIGDVMEGCPELTPVAIQAGKILARRLFGGSTEPMDYTNICTTVFTPIEYGTVGYSEEAAIEKFGSKNIEVYHKSFIPLEWTLSDARSHSSAFTKVIVDKTKDEKVLGIHYVGPSAGEVLQGYGVAVKKGITYNDLAETVGIHPTCSEEIVRLNIKKSSGEDAGAEGC